jgi:hypothetical protein
MGPSATVGGCAGRGLEVGHVEDDVQLKFSQSFEVKTRERVSDPVLLG